MSVKHDFAALRILVQFPRWGRKLPTLVDQFYKHIGTISSFLQQFLLKGQPFTLQSINDVLSYII